MEKDIILVVIDIRSCHNVGSLLRTADGLGISKVYLIGYTPYPKRENDNRLPYIANKIDSKIIKTSLGAEKYVKWIHEPDIIEVLKSLKVDGYHIIALEQSDNSIDLDKYKAPDKIVLVIGNEVTGVDKTILALCETIVSVPMLGKKESFNVVQATAMALYRFRYFD